MYTERSFLLSLSLSLSHSFFSLCCTFVFDKICIHGNESQDPEGRQVAMRHSSRVAVCVHTVKMKWPRALITVQKGLKTGMGNVDHDA